MVGGAEASHIAVDCILQYFNKETYSDIRQALKDALDFANLQIIGTAFSAATAFPAWFPTNKSKRFFPAHRI
jgi:hypothetical protein